MHRYGIRQNNFIQFGVVVVNLTGIKDDHHFLVYGINAFNPTNITIKNLLFIIVSDLHYLVVDPELQATSDYPLFSGVELLLQLRVQILSPHHTFVHGSQHLNVIKWIKPKTSGYALFGELQYYPQNLIRIFLFDKVEILVRPVWSLNCGKLTAVDSVSVYDDGTLLGLAKNLIQLHHFGCTRVDDIFQNIASSNRW